MRKFVMTTVAALVMPFLPAALQSQQGSAPALSISAVRFYQPASGTTTIEGVCEVRLATLFAGVRQSARYRFEVRVTDSAGLELLRTDWMRDLPAEWSRLRGATTIETFRFAAAPGRYLLHVRATPESGEAVERDVEVAAFRARPPISDLMLATAVRRPASDTEALAPGEVRRAGLAMRTAPAPKLTPTEATLAYYAEVYPWQSAPGSGELRAQVVRADGRVMLATPPRTVTIDTAGGLTRGSLDLTGLPEGEYRFRLQVRMGDSTLVTEAPFAMAPLGTGMDAPRTAAADVFEGADEARLDSLYAPLVYLLDPRGEQGVYGTLSVEGKRRFLREFWHRRDPTPADADNPAMAEFYRSVAFVNDAFREGGAGQIPGWRTDRGRIYLKYGRWDEILRRPAASPRPYEVWRITRERLRYYVFYDQSGFGHYVLLGTNDRRETGLPNWEQYLGGEGADDVRRFLGLQDTGNSDR